MFYLIANKFFLFLNIMYNFGPTNTENTGQYIFILPGQDIKLNILNVYRKLFSIKQGSGYTRPPEKDYPTVSVSYSHRFLSTV